MNLPGSDVEDYVLSLDRLLTQKQNEISQLKEQISTFYNHIQEEKQLSQQFYSMKKEEGIEIEQEYEEY